MLNFDMTINGQAQAGKELFDVINPANQEVIGQAPEATKADVDTAVAAANTAFVSWQHSTSEQRKQLIGALMGALHQNMDSFAEILTLEQGKPLSAAKDEVGASLHWCQTALACELTVETLEKTDHSHVQLHHKPLGVVAGIIPWNFPLMSAFMKLLPALLTGNTLILKPSPYTPLTALKLGELCRDIFPAGVVNVLSGGDELGKRLVAHDGIAKVTFTGSSAAGKQIMSSAAGNLKRLTLELGGNDAGIVLPDFDLQNGIEKLFWSAFYNSGQVCAALKRLYVHESIYEAVCQGLAQYAGYIPMGDGMAETSALGPVQNKVQFDKVCSLAASAKAQGGRVLCGGEALEGPGYFFPVTIVADLPDDADLVTQEPFGPILPVLKYSDIDEVITRANSTREGLGGSIWTQDLAKGAELALRLECGSAWVNQHAAVRPDVPFCGAKESGIGVENTELGMKEFTRVQVVNVAAPVAEQPAR